MSPDQVPCTHLETATTVKNPERLEFDECLKMGSLGAPLGK